MIALKGCLPLKANEMIGVGLEKFKLEPAWKYLDSFSLGMNHSL